MHIATNMNNYNEKLSTRELVIAIIVAIITLIICAIGDTIAYGQVVLDGKTYKSTSVPKAKQEPIATGYEWQDSKGNTYPILMSPSTGSCFVLKISSKSGKEYRQYLGEEISRDICARLGREYKSTKK